MGGFGAGGFGAADIGSDVLPPVFAGLATAVTGTGSGTVDLTWLAASDDITPTADIIYEVHFSRAPGDPFQVRWTTAPGATSVTIPELLSGVLYYFRVRARDLAGNVDANTVEKSATSSSSPAGAPQITNVVPVAGTTILPNSTISFDVIDTTNPLRRVIVSVTHGSTANVTEVVHDGTDFKGGYQYVSSRTVITNGYHYTLQRTGGWFSSPYFAVYAVDAEGVEN